jgi:putative membrane protein
MRHLGQSVALGLSLQIMASAAAAGGRASSPAPELAGELAASETARLLDELHRLSLLHIELGKLTMSRATLPAVRAYGDLLVREHTRANRLVKAFARRRGIRVPSDPPGPETRELAQKAATLTRLQGLRGADFDREIQAVVPGDDTRIIGTLEMARARVGDARLRALIRRLLPLWRRHRVVAERLTVYRA